MSFGCTAMTDTKRNDNVPPNSRLFIVCGKSVEEEDFKDAFSTFGEVGKEKLSRPVDGVHSRWRVCRSTRTGRARARASPMSSLVKPPKLLSPLRR